MLVRKTRCCRQGPHAPKTLSKCSCMTSREVSQARTKRNENEAPDRGEGSDQQYFFNANEERQG